MTSSFSTQQSRTLFVPRWLLALAMVGSMQAQVVSAARESTPLVSAAIEHGASRPAVSSAVAVYPPVIAQAIAAAQSRIKAGKKCRRFFDDRGLETMGLTIYSLQELGPGSVAAYVEGNRVFLNLNPKGAFMSPPTGFAGMQSAEEIRGFYILHELAHELSRATKFQVDHSASQSMNKFRHDNNDDLLKMNCY
ncbi:MAG TPA: hypothetical protein VF532_07770 [Candidatus Angelobacter sp.]